MGGDEMGTGYVPRCELGMNLGPQNALKSSRAWGFPRHIGLVSAGGP